ncbi:chitin-binding protein [Dyella acidiphila]|uniref:Chitin-binding protein n=1 Tax=Dyella acidiphila TaxID=2775866 RepID=A0ABR9GE12_9GAMM|nr:chitin-binding protein [Dyella acidiphila]MBE1162234.1 chitin-binding protein [Dyella acidiphila]
MVLGALCISIGTAISTAAFAASPMQGGSATELPSAAEKPANASSGDIGFHLLLGAGAAQDHMVLDGENYTDLIMSNVIAGVMYGHLVDTAYPGIQYNKDYLYGSIFAQLLQENIQTQLYDHTSDLLDPSPDQQAVMSVGQGGPYQINYYAADMVAGGYEPKGHSMINYVAIQKNIGYTMDTAAGQWAKPTPQSFNNKYYGPILAAYFHYNDFVSLKEVGKDPNGPWMPPWQPDYDHALENFKTLPNSFLDVLLNVAYNQGFYGPLVSQYSKLGVTATSETVDAVNAYAAVWGKQDTYQQYPYQVHYYLDQLYDNPIPTDDPANTVMPKNHVVFKVKTLRDVFSKVFQTLDHLDGSGKAVYITAKQAEKAFDSALGNSHMGLGEKLDLSKTKDRAKIFKLLERAISGLESNLGTKFNATTLTQH